MLKLKLNLIVRTYFICKIWILDKLIEIIVKDDNYHFSIIKLNSLNNNKKSFFI